MRKPEVCARGRGTRTRGKGTRVGERAGERGRGVRQGSKGR
jgi:hypothetical protein